jgi:hypothetical protein
LRGALDIAARVPATVVQSGALAFLTHELAQSRDDVTTVVWHSVVWQYVDPAERTAVDELLHDVGHPLVRISLEPEARSYAFRVHATTYPSGRRVHLADALGHGPPVHWTGATIDL